MSQHYEKSNEKRLVKVLLLVVIVLLLIIIGLGAYFVLEKDTPVSTAGGLALNIDPNADEYVAPAVEENTPSTGVAVPGWGRITIPANTTNIAVDFFNPEANKDLYYLTFELRLMNDSELGYEVLYTSGLVEPGLHIQEIVLSRGLEAGTYDAVIHVQPYMMNAQRTPTNNADMKTELVVK